MVSSDYDIFLPTSTWRNSRNVLKKINALGFPLFRCGVTVTLKKRQVTNKERSKIKDLSKTSHCRLKVVYLPWQEHRPYDGGFAYNCLLARFQLGSNQSEVEVRAVHCQTLSREIFQTCNRSLMRNVGASSASLVGLRRPPCVFL